MISSAFSTYAQPQHMPLSIKPPYRPSPNSQSPSESASPPSIDSFLAGREHTPEAPPVSPLSPVLKAATLSTLSNSSNADASTGISQPTGHRLTPQADHQNGKTRMPSDVQLIDRPPPLPFSAEDSMDAIALRAAISSLQFQRVKAQQDLRTLQEIKNQAVERPEEFRQYIIQSASKPAQGKQSGRKWSPPPDDDYMDSEDDTIAGAELGEHQYASHRNNIHAGEVPDSQHASFSSTLASQPNPSQERNTKRSSFPAIPVPQEIVRCPPIEWAKYHIHGESLDRLHKEQQMRPGVGGLQGPEQVIAAPYNPFVDVLEERPARGADARKDSGASAAEQPAQRRRSSKASPATK